MAFVFSIDPNEPIEVNNIQGNGEFISRLAIGYDDQTGVVYSAFAALSPLPGYHDLGGYELVFNVTSSDLDGVNIEVFWNGVDTQSFLKGNHRTIVLAALCVCVKSLIDVGKPSIVNMVTRSPHLPERALRKYHIIADVFREDGYTAKQADPWNGQRIWIMELQIS